MSNGFPYVRRSRNGIPQSRLPRRIQIQSLNVQCDDAKNEPICQPAHPITNATGSFRLYLEKELAKLRDGTGANLWAKWNAGATGTGSLRSRAHEASAALAR